MSSDYEQLSELGKRARERLQAITPGQGDVTLMQEVAALRDENRRLRKVVETLLIDAEDSAGAAMLGLALDLHLLSNADIQSSGFSAWEPDRLCALWALKGHADE